MNYDGNEVGRAARPGRIQLDRAEVEQTLSRIARTPIRLPVGVIATTPPAICPACGSTNVIWGCDPDLPARPQPEIHPLVWDAAGWMADSFVCLDCDAGWIEPDEAAETTWVRPYWKI